MKRKIIFLAFFLFTTPLALAADIDYSYKNSISIQVGINGVMHNGHSFELQFFPPDLSYAREIFENEILDISTATFYDNIGVEINGANFSYRVGQRIDVGLKIGNYVPYATLGFGIIKYPRHRQTSPVYGIGFLEKITKRFLWVNEINFQDVFYQNSYNTIANISTGIVYNF